MEITDAAIEAAVQLSERYLNDRYLPDKAIDLIDEAFLRNSICRLFMHSLTAHRNMKESGRFV